MKPTEDQLRKWFSSERMYRYEQLPGDTYDNYVKNAHRAVLALEIIQHVEVMVRNVIHRELTEKQGDNNVLWFDDNHKYKFTAKMQKDVKIARGRADGAGTSPGKIISELTFGTWTFLLSARHSSNVWPNVRDGFRGVPRSQRNREQLHKTMKRLNDLRNRCSHSEAIYLTDDKEFLHDIHYAASYVDPEAAAWLLGMWNEIKP